MNKYWKIFKEGKERVRHLYMQDLLPDAAPGICDFVYFIHPMPSAIKGEHQETVVCKFANFWTKESFADLQTG
jgi:hypothetical protein